MAEQTNNSQDAWEPNQQNDFQAVDESMADLPDSASQAADSQAIDSLDHRLVEAQRAALLAQAELENFRKRMQREQELSLKYANMPLVRDLLDVIDNLNRATQSAPADSMQSEGGQALLSGVQMVTEQFVNVLAKYGCKRIETAGKPFDPNVHQAISQMPSEQQPAGTIMHEVAVGYMLHDRVVRPSNVIVSSGIGS